MKNLWHLLLHSAEVNNVQLFISTHNIDSIKGLVEVLGEEEFINLRKDIQTFKLIHSKDGLLHSFPYDYEALNYSVEQNIEVR